MKHSATAATELLLERQCAGRALAGTSAMAVVGQVPAGSRHLRRQRRPVVAEALPQTVLEGFTFADGWQRLGPITASPSQRRIFSLPK